MLSQPGGGLHTEMIHLPHAVTNPGTNQAQRRATLLTESHALPVHHATIGADG